MAEPIFFKAVARRYTKTIWKSIEFTRLAYAEQAAKNQIHDIGNQGVWLEFVNSVDHPSHFWNEA